MLTIEELFEQSRQSCLSVGAVQEYLSEHEVNDASTGFTILDRVAADGHLDLVKVVVESGADIQSHDSYALGRAQRFGHQTVVQYLREAAQIIDTITKLGITYINDRHRYLAVMQSPALWPMLQTAVISTRNEVDKLIAAQTSSEASLL